VCRFGLAMRSNPLLDPPFFKGREREVIQSNRSGVVGIAITTPIGFVGMKSLIVKHSIVMKGRRTTIGIEDAFWHSLKEIAQERGVTLTTLVSTVDTERDTANLASALRLFVLDHYREVIRRATQGPNWPLIG
jgi:predicted DNA-binding ribbon-helix-helix protein